MQPDITDETLAEDLAAQARIIKDAYASGEQYKIDQALIRVTQVRRMKAQGLYDLLAGPQETDAPNDQA